MTNIDPSKSSAARPLPSLNPASRQRTAPQRAKTAPSKSDVVAKLLTRPKGVTIAEVSSVTGWQPHSVRAFLSGLRKKGSAVERETRKDGTTSYRVTPLMGKLIPPVATTLSVSDNAAVDMPGNAA